jgi:hypothetical protein
LQSNIAKSICGLYLEPTNHSCLRYKPLNIGPLIISIQAGKGYYCHPRDEFDDINMYSEFEVAIIAKSGAWFHPESHHLFSGESWASYWDSSGDVAAYMPREEVEKMIASIMAAMSPCCDE